METTKQQLYEKKDMPKGFYPKDAIVFKKLTIDSGYFDTDSTFEECLAAVKAGVNFIILVKQYNNYSIHASDEIYNYNPLDTEELYDETVCVVLHRIELDGNINKYYYVYKKDGSKEIITKYIINPNVLLRIYSLTDTINNLKTGNIVAAYAALRKEIPNKDYTQITWALGSSNTIGLYNGHKVFTSSPGGNVVFTWFEGNGLTITNKINILSFTGNRNNGIVGYKYDVIDLGQANSLYRASPMNIEPITNPKIWIGNATQYAAIAEKDPNTTYIVKSE